MKQLEIVKAAQALSTPTMTVTARPWSRDGAVGNEVVTRYGVDIEVTAKGRRGETLQTASMSIDDMDSQTAESIAKLVKSMVKDIKARLKETTAAIRVERQPS